MLDQTTCGGSEFQTVTFIVAIQIGFDFTGTGYQMFVKFIIFRSVFIIVNGLSEIHARFHMGFPSIFQASFNVGVVLIDVLLGCIVDFAWGSEFPTSSDKFRVTHKTFRYIFRPFSEKYPFGNP